MKIVSNIYRTKYNLTYFFHLSTIRCHPGRPNPWEEGWSCERYHRHHRVKPHRLVGCCEVLPGIDRSGNKPHTYGCQFLKLLFVTNLKAKETTKYPTAMLGSLVKFSNLIYCWISYLLHFTSRKAVEPTWINLTLGLNLGGRPKWRIQLSLEPRSRTTSASSKALDLAGATDLGFESSTSPENNDMRHQWRHSFKDVIS